MPDKQIETYDVGCDLMCTIGMWGLWVHGWEILGMWSQHFEVFKNFFHHWVVKCLAFVVMAKIQMDSTKQYIADYNRTRRQPWHVFGRIVVPCYEWVFDEVSNLFGDVSWYWWMTRLFVGIWFGLWCLKHVILIAHPIKQWSQAEDAQKKQSLLQTEREKERKRMQSLDALDAMEASNEKRKRKRLKRSINENIEILNREIEDLDDEATTRFESAISEMQEPNTVVERVFGALATAAKSIFSWTIPPLGAVVGHHAKPTKSSRVVVVQKPVVGKVCTRVKLGLCKAKDAAQFTGQKRMCDDCHNHAENNPVSMRACRARSPRSKTSP